MSPPDPVRVALLKAVTALWFGDDADYGTALWEVVRILRPGLPEDVDLEVLRNALIEEGSADR